MRNCTVLLITWCFTSTERCFTTTWNRQPSSYSSPLRTRSSRRMMTSFSKSLTRFGLMRSSASSWSRFSWTRGHMAPDKASSQILFNASFILPGHADWMGAYKYLFQPLLYTVLYEFAPSVFPAVRRLIILFILMCDDWNRYVHSLHHKSYNTGNDVWCCTGAIPKTN